jgi:hypothetical protein
MLHSAPKYFQKHMQSATNIENQFRRGRRLVLGGRVQPTLDRSQPPLPSYMTLSLLTHAHARGAGVAPLYF